MNGSGRAGNGRGNNRKHPFRRREKDGNSWQEREPQENTADSDFSKRANNRGQPSPGIRTPAGNRNPPPRPVQWSEENQGRQNRSGMPKKGGDTRTEKAPFVERPRWIPPVFNNEPLPNPNCPWCGKPIRDIVSAIIDKDTGVPVHFDCVTARITEGENLDKGDTVTYIGGGRFGIVSFIGSDNQNFKIKKVIEWENKDKKAEWRNKISDHYSIT